MARPAEGDPFDLAEERVGFAQLARAALWTSIAAMAVFGAVLAAQSETGAKRLTAALDALPASTRAMLFLPPAASPASSVTAAPRPADADMRVLAEKIETLASEHARLAARIEALERSADVTASVPPAPAGGAGADTPAVPVITRTDFGLDLGPGISLDALRAQWTTIKAQHGAVLEGLRPVVSVQDHPQGRGLELRLVVGPLVNAAEAARLCMVISATGRPCQPAPFEGQRLALK